jgi:hypothetical protein
MNRSLKPMRRSSKSIGDPLKSMAHPSEWQIVRIQNKRGCLKIEIEAASSE